MDTALYNMAILRLAAAIPHAGRLAAPVSSATRTSPVCGSRVVADVELDAAGRVVRFAQEVRACALGQASAAVLGGGVMEATPAMLADAADALGRWLAGEGALPACLAGRFGAIAALEPARAHPARHASIRLPFEAASAAARAAAAATADA